MEEWTNVLHCMLSPFGVRAIRAGSCQEAQTCIQTVPVHLAVVDLDIPLAQPGPEPGGVRLLEILARLSAPPPTIVVKRSHSHRDDRREIAAALRAGAFAVVERPRSQRDTELVLEVFRRLLGRYYRGQWPASPPPNA